MQTSTIPFRVIAYTALPAIVLYSSVPGAITRACPPGFETRAWTAMGEPGGVVTAITTWNGRLVANSLASGPAVREWTGTSWVALDWPSPASVWVLGTHNGDLVAGGNFSAAGSETAANIARFDGSSWAALGSGVGGPVHAVAEHGGELIVGGSFATAGGAPAVNVARWNGSRWAPLGDGLDGTVRALIVYDGDLIAGGQFTATGTTPVNSLARWNGTGWAPMGSGVGPGLRQYVYTLAVYGGSLVAGGSFNVANSQPVPHVARWEPATGVWGPVGSGLSGSPEALLEWNGELVAAGYFSGSVARWNGSTWRTMGGGGSTNSSGRCLHVVGGDLLLGGSFTVLDGRPIRYVARWAVVDQDGDGVPDACDACPATATGASVDAQGCPPFVPGDFDRDGDVDATDFEALVRCTTGPAIPYEPSAPPPGCTLPTDVEGLTPADLDRDGDVDMDDFGRFQRCFRGSLPADPLCRA